MARLSSTNDSDSPTDTASTQYRHEALRRTASIVLHPSATDSDYRSEAFPQLTALLTSSLEQLRVVESTLAFERDEIREQTALLEARIQYERRLFDCAPVALLVTNLVGAITEANRAAAQLLGYTAEQLDRQQLSEFVTREDREAFRAAIERIRDIETPTTWTLRLAPRRTTAAAVVATVVPVAHGNRFGDLPALFWSLLPG